MIGLRNLITLAAPVVFAVLLPAAQAEKMTLPLSQEQDGGTAGRACMYIHQGKAEFRIVRTDAVCPATVTVDRQPRRT